MNLFTIPPENSFLDAVASGWLDLAQDDPLREAHGDPLRMARGLLLLPTRRSARALADAFLRVTNGKPLLLPRIVALGALDEAPLALAGALDIPPAVEPARRLAQLSRLILAMGGAGGAPRSADAAWRLAVELAALMDEAERADIDLARKLPDAADEAFASHWQETLKFLSIVTAAWPAWLAEEGLMNAAARQVALLNAQAAAWAAQAPPHPVWAVGSTGGIPAVARLLRVVARLPNGRVVLPGLDQNLSERAWEAVETSHPQAGMRRLLTLMGAVRGDVLPWPVLASTATPAERAGLLSAALLPAPALDEWLGAADPDLRGLSRLQPADQQEEAVAIALILRDALEKPGTRAALITPDRELAGRVAAELGRFGIIADDSAGEPLAETPPAVFLRLLARAVAEQLAPVPLLALLKHPLTAAGLSPAMCRAAARALEQAALRGPRPPAGLTGLRRQLGDKKSGTEAAQDLLARLEACVAPLFRLFNPARGEASTVPPSALLAALIEAGEALARTDAAQGPALLWSGEEGEALAELLAGVQAPLSVLLAEPPGVLPGLLDALLEGATVRSRRALRGRDLRGSEARAANIPTEHPRIFIWGLLEARLQTVDVAVLGGLLEGVWPPATDPGPWLSRPMRARVGLPAPEEAIGQAAHDFSLAACAAPVVVLSAPRRRDNAPAVPARWLARLDAFLAGKNTALALHPATGWARALDRPAGPAQPILPPRPSPPYALRPRQLSVTAVETWLRDPFAIYAREILRLRKLDPIDDVKDVLEYGMLVHAGLHRYLDQHGIARPPDMAEKLRDAMHHELQEAGLREALLAWWAPRLTRIATWIAETERERPKLRNIQAEVSGAWDIPGAGFRLRGRADRIEHRVDNSLAILDYKTGTPPSQAAVDAGLAPQLALEAAMAEAGGFGPDFQGMVTELTYWHLTGGQTPGEARLLHKGDPARTAALIAESEAGLRRLIAAYDDPAQPYLAQPRPGAAPRFSDYAHLARVGEWSIGGELE